MGEEDVRHNRLIDNDKVFKDIEKKLKKYEK